MAWGKKEKLGKSQAWDFVKNDWKIKEMDVIYSLDTKEDISITFELTNILQKTIENYWYNKRRCPTVPEPLVEEQCFLNLSSEYFEDKNSCRKIIPLMFGSEKTKRKMKRKVLVEREIGKREWNEWINREENQEEYYND
tara:strand:- start:38 stop:454 length:417 start_codon:yes stop_codon:yes gene_type:complete